VADDRGEALDFVVGIEEIPRALRDHRLERGIVVSELLLGGLHVAHQAAGEK
jgi:hypothetical protein